VLMSITQRIAPIVMMATLLFPRPLLGAMLPQDSGVATDLASGRPITYRVFDGLVVVDDVIVGKLRTSKPTDL